MVDENDNQEEGHNSSWNQKEEFLLWAGYLCRRAGA